jgi:hypothetical protein
MSGATIVKLIVHPSSNEDSISFDSGNNIALLVSHEYLEWLSFNAMLGEAQKLKVANSRLSI